MPLQLEGDYVNRALPIVLAVVLLCVSLVAWGESARLHPALQSWIQTSLSVSTDIQDPDSVFFGSDGFQIVFSPTGQARISVLVETAEPVIAERFLGVPIRFSLGHILGAAVSLGDLLRFQDDERVVYVEPSWKTRPTLDRSVPAVGGEIVHDASPPILGQGVIVGLVDTGIDYQHLDFRYDADGNGSEESTRILAIWDQTWGLFGTSYSKDDIESDLASGYGPNEGAVRQADRDGHGTHVASIAAGDGSSSPAGFIGMAPAAWIVAVKTTFFTADILEAVEYVFDEADRRGLPAVVNLSLGGHEGPHDGTSLFERGLDELSSGPGRLVVVSAGNEGDQLIHVSGALSGNAKEFDVVPEAWELELNLWYPGASRFTVTVTAPGGDSVSAAAGTASGFVVTSNGIAYINNSMDGPNPNNGDREVLVRLSNVRAGDRWRVAVRDASGGGRFDGWITTASGRIIGGDSASTIDEPGNARRVLTVGSFNTKNTWPSLAGQQDYAAEFPLGSLSDFSSQGPTRDGRTKPEIAAPGAWICAALSSSAPAIGFLVNPDGVHTMELGTSMSAPHVSGAAALLFSLDEDLTAEAVRTLLTSTATRDTYTGSVPNQRWGWGKLNIANAVAEIDIVEPPVEPPSEERPTVHLEENPVSGLARFVITLPEGTSSAVLRIYALSGQRVFETEIMPGSDRYEWTLRTDASERLAAGLYLYVLVSDRGTSAVGKLVIER